MFKKEQRYSFKRGFPKKAINSNYFGLRYQENPEGVKAGVVVGKKIDKRATVRNRIKRRFVHALKEILKEKDVKSDLVFFLKKPILEKNYLEIKEIVEKELQRLK